MRSKGRIYKCGSEWALANTIPRQLYKDPAAAAELRNLNFLRVILNSWKCEDLFKQIVAECEEGKIYSPADATDENGEDDKHLLP
jgi:hypothetical protein